MKRFLLCIAAAVLMAGCSSAKSDMGGYEGFGDKDHVYRDTTVKEAAEKMEKGETFVLYFGFDHCPWCIEAVPILNKAAKDSGYTVDYINTRADASWTSNIDIDDYDTVVELFGDYLDYDDEGIKHLYTPHVFFIRDGKVVYEQEGTIEGHSAIEESLSEEEEGQVYKFYSEGFSLLK